VTVLGIVVAAVAMFGVVVIVVIVVIVLTFSVAGHGERCNAFTNWALLSAFCRKAVPTAKS